MSHSSRDLDKWLASQTGALHKSLDELLDIDAGLGDAKLSDVQAGMTDSLTPVLDVEAGLDNIHPPQVPEASQSARGPRVLLVEPNDLMAEALVSLLRSHGLAVHRSSLGRDVLGLIGEADVILLELGLPDLDGLTLVRQIREISDIPLIVITSRDALRDQVQGLRAGADDYLAKPFPVTELLARVDAVRRRRSPVSAQSKTGRFTFGTITVDTTTHEVSVAGEPISLSRKEFELLRLLVNAHGAVLRRPELLEEVWGSAFAGTSASRSLDVHIAALRAKLGDPAMIETVRGIGYRLVSRRLD